MNREQIKEYIKTHPEQHLKRDKAGTGYICPICGSGSGENGTGITTKDGTHFTCWSGECFTHADIIDIIGIENQMTDYNDKLMKAADIYNVEIEKGNYSIQGNPSFNKAPSSEKTAPNLKVNKELEEKHEKIKKYLNTLKNRPLAAADEKLFHEYLQSRGISVATAEKHGILFDPNFKWGTQGKEWKALVIPTSEMSFNARNIDPAAGSGDRFRKAGETHLFNFQEFKKSENIFIVEGEIDALSITEAGGNAVAVGSVSNIKLVAPEIKKYDTNKQFKLFIMLDNDENGKRANKQLIESLESELNNIKTYQPEILSIYKDPNQALTENREQFIKDVKVWTENPEKEFYNKDNAKSHIQGFLDKIADSRINTNYIRTGFDNLDKLLDGGLYEGLYFLGAISSLGKTTFILQLADQIAEQGHDVLFISLEMARYELMAKSISRHTSNIAIKKGMSSDKAKTARGITTGSRYDLYDNEEMNLIAEAVEEYGEYAENIFIHEGIGDIGVKDIKELVEIHTRVKKKRPVVIIDYIQILAPANDRYTDKQNTDKNVMELKRISRDYKIPIIGISSFNRDNYEKSVSMVSFKESGAIEYSSDVLIGLQFQGQGNSNLDIDVMKKETPRRIELKLLKNRNGRSSGSINYRYYPLFNVFEEE